MDDPRPEVVDGEEDRVSAQANRLFETALMLLEQKRPIDKAIKCIQKAITLDDNNYRYWQLLGEAYFHRGSLNPSINCFIKSQNLAQLEQSEDEDELQAKEFACTHSKLRMSDIRFQAGHLDEAASGYSDIIAKYPDHVDALIGLSKTNLSKCKHAFHCGLVTSGHSHCMQALNLVLKAIKYASQMSEAWQLASECCLTQFIDGQRGDYETKIESDFPGSDGGIIKINRLSCIELAQRFLCKALENAEPKKSFILWHNIGMCLYFRALMSDDKSTKSMLLIRSIKSYLKALNQDRASSQIRNSIGLAAYHLNLLNTAQSFIIKSIHTDKNTSEIQFSNLGYIYLKHGLSDKAAASFDRCQAEEPLYPRSWFGKSLIQENLGIDNLSYLRHCRRLGNNYEPQLKFSTRISNLPESNITKKDIHDALDSLRKIVKYDDKCLQAWNSLGLLYEKCRIYDRAIECFDRAYQINPDSQPVIANRLRLTSNFGCFDSDHQNMIAKGEFLNKAEKLAEIDVRYLKNYLFYLFSNQDFRTVEPGLNKLMDLIDHKDMSAIISTKMLLGLSRNKNSVELDIFINNMSTLNNSNCIESVINMIVMMMICFEKSDTRHDATMSKCLSRAIQGYIESKSMSFNQLLESKDGYWIKIALFSSIFCLGGSSVIKPILASFPVVPELWLLMGLETMWRASKKQDSSVFCFEKSARLGSTKPDLVFICDIMLSILCLSKQKNPFPMDNRIKHLQRAIFKYPQYSHLISNMDRAKKVKSLKRDELLTGPNLDWFVVAINHITNKLIL